ncbi:MAG: hypothetical protein PQJ58_18520 [Spirochaetales bacterium]|nr:hypothetical protein [Spirochaetales bacterium]
MKTPICDFLERVFHYDFVEDLFTHPSWSLKLRKKMNPIVLKFTGFLRRTNFLKHHSDYLNSANEENLKGTPYGSLLFLPGTRFQFSGQDIYHSDTVFRWRTVQYRKNNTHCSSCNDHLVKKCMSDEEYLLIPSVYEIKRPFRKRFMGQCPGCGRNFKSSLYPFFYNSVLLPDKAVSELSKWYQEKTGLPLFSRDDNTKQTEKGETIYYWDNFLKASVNGLETCPEEPFKAILNYSSKRELRQMVRGKTHVRVFSPFSNWLQDL